MTAEKKSSSPLKVVSDLVDATLAEARLIYFLNPELNRRRERAGPLGCLSETILLLYLCPEKAPAAQNVGLSRLNQTLLYKKTANKKSGSETQLFYLLIFSSVIYMRKNLCMVLLNF